MKRKCIVAIVLMSYMISFNIRVYGIDNQEGAREEFITQVQPEEVEGLAEPGQSDDLEDVDESGQSDDLEDVNEPEQLDNLEDVDGSEQSDNLEDVDESGQSDDLEDVNEQGQSDNLEDVDEPDNLEDADETELRGAMGAVITLDGNFDDWYGMPYIDDSADDGTGDGSQYKIKGMRYFADDEYLYVYIERPISSGYNTYEVQVVIFNGSGPKQNVWVPWLNKETPWGYNTLPATVITAQLEKEKDDYNLVKVSGAGIYEQTYSGNKEGTKMEFRIPLASLGLTGHSKEIQFNVKADVRQDFPKQDWIYDEGPICDTTGPIFGKLTGVVLLLGLGYVISRYKKVNQVKKI